MGKEHRCFFWKKLTKGKSEQAPSITALKEEAGERRGVGKGNGDANQRAKKRVRASGGTFFAKIRLPLHEEKTGLGEKGRRGRIPGLKE